MTEVSAVTQTGVMKRCYRCVVNKDTAEFHKFARNADGRQPNCRACKKEIDRELYERNPRRNYERNKANAIRNRRWLHDYLSTKQCEWKGCTVNDPDMLVLYHLDPSEKRGAVTRLAHQTFSLETIRVEISKCRVLCANHHHKHTIQQFGYKKWRDDE